MALKALVAIDDATLSWAEVRYVRTPDGGVIEMIIPTVQGEDGAPVMLREVQGPLDPFAIATLEAFVAGRSTKVRRETGLDTAREVKAKEASTDGKAR